MRIPTEISSIQLPDTSALNTAATMLGIGAFVLLALAVVFGNLKWRKSVRVTIAVLLVAAAIGAFAGASSLGARASEPRLDAIVDWIEADFGAEITSGDAARLRGSRIFSLPTITIDLNGELTKVMLEEYAGDRITLVDANTGAAIEPIR